MSANNTQVSEKPRTRAQILREKVVIRIAADDGPAICALLKENNVEFPAADWDSTTQHWLVATLDDEVIGCILVLPARPIGVLEFLFSKPTVPFKMRVIALQKLAFQGAATLSVFGSSYIACTVEVQNKAFQKALEKYGFRTATTTAVMVKRLKELQ